MQREAKCKKLASDGPDRRAVAEPGAARFRLRQGYGGQVRLGF